MDEPRFYRALRFISALPRWYFRLSVEGAAFVPTHGACVVAANHASYLDPVVLAMACPRPVRFVVDGGQYRRPLVHWIAVRTGAIPVENAVRDLRSLRLALGALREGSVLGIFPEGGRSEDGAVHAGRPGAALLALRTGAPLVPAGICGTFGAYSRHHLLPRPRPVTVRFGEPLAIRRQPRAHASREELEDLTARLMERIRGLVC